LKHKISKRAYTPWPSTGEQLREGFKHPLPIL
jgi:hypothetical protein